jgi:hypothetical protein
LAFSLPATDGASAELAGAPSCVFAQRPTHSCVSGHRTKYSAGTAGILLCVFLGAFPTYNISDLKAFTFQTFADIEAEDGHRLVRVLHGQLSRYVKENTAPPSVKVGNGRRSDLDAWIRAGGILAFKKAEGTDANFKINSSS